MLDLSGDGYSNIERYIHGIDPKAEEVNWKDPKNNGYDQDKTREVI